VNSTAPTGLPLVLLVDDDASFRWLVGYAFRKSGIQAVLECVGDGEEAIKYLSGEEPFSDQKRYPRPTVVLLDLKMPRVSGWEVLKWKDARTDMDSIHFVVMSCSDLSLDRDEASKYGIRDYRVKPMDLGALIGIVKSLEKFFPDQARKEFAQSAVEESVASPPLHA